jgi:hypothetical protein
MWPIHHPYSQTSARSCSNNFIIYVLFKIKLYKNCLFERFVNMYLLSMFVNYNTCALVLLFGSNYPYRCRNNCWMFAIRHVWYNAFVNFECIIECHSEIMKSLSVWPTVLFEAAIFVRYTVLDLVNCCKNR